jgi:hypothetical protein
MRRCISVLFSHLKLKEKLSKILTPFNLQLFSKVHVFLWEKMKVTVLRKICIKKRKNRYISLLREETQEILQEIAVKKIGL